MESERTSRKGIFGAREDIEERKISKQGLKKPSKDGEILR